jgi:hypothetical protein
MGLTVVDAHRCKLIVTDDAVISAQKAAPAEIGALVARLLLGPTEGRFIAGDVQPLLQRGQTSVLHLGRGNPLPAITEMNTATSCFASEVPKELKRQKGWPRLRDFRLVTFYPRQVIRDITLSWAGALTIRLLSSQDDASLRVYPWGWTAAREALHRFGYPLR